MATAKHKTKQVNMKGLALKIDQLIDSSGNAVDVVGGSNRIVTITSATTLSADTHESRTVVFNAAAGIAITLPAASGSGAKYKLVCGTTITSNSTTIKVANASDVMAGFAIVAQDGGDTVVMFETASTSDTITFNGSTTAGIKGDIVELEDVAANLWSVRITASATGTEATPFSATVS